MKHPDGKIIVFPYQDEVDRYTLKGALRDAEINIEEFIKISNRKTHLNSGDTVRNLEANN